jgi:hypothetical protein
MILISGPAIGQLCQHTRKWAHDTLRRGSFGPVTRGPGGVLYADLTAVEGYSGLQFTDDQIEAAVAGIPDRLLTIVQTKSEIEKAA